MPSVATFDDTFAWIYLCGGFASLVGFSFMVFLNRSYPRFRKHPEGMLLWLSLCGLIISSKYWFAGFFWITRILPVSDDYSFKVIPDNCQVAGILANFAASASLWWQWFWCLNLCMTIANPFRDSKTYLPLYHTVAWGGSFVYTVSVVLCGAVGESLDGTCWLKNGSVFVLVCDALFGLTGVFAGFSVAYAWKKLSVGGSNLNPRHRRILICHSRYVLWLLLVWVFATCFFIATTLEAHAKEHSVAYEVFRVLNAASSCLPAFFVAVIRLFEPGVASTLKRRWQRFRRRGGRGRGEQRGRYISIAQGGGITDGEGGDCDWDEDNSGNAWRSFSLPPSSGKQSLLANTCDPLSSPWSPTAFSASSPQTASGRGGDSRTFFGPDSEHALATTSTGGLSTTSPSGGSGSSVRGGTRRSSAARSIRSDSASTVGSSRRALSRERLAAGEGVEGSSAEGSLAASYGISQLGLSLRSEMEVQLLAGLCRSLAAEARQYQATAVSPSARGTGEHRLSSDCAFQSHGAELFAAIRRNCGILEQSIVDVMIPELYEAGLIKSKVSEGKSGSFFCRSADDRFFLKTIPANEREELLKLLPAYHHHLRLHPYSLLVRFLGCYTLLPRAAASPLHLVLMTNVFNPPPSLALPLSDDAECDALAPPSLRGKGSSEAGSSSSDGSGGDDGEAGEGDSEAGFVEEVYDLKGSTVGRGTLSRRQQKYLIEAPPNLCVVDESCELACNDGAASAPLEAVSTEVEGVRSAVGVSSASGPLADTNTPSVDHRSTRAKSAGTQAAAAAEGLPKARTQSLRLMVTRGVPAPAATIAGRAKRKSVTAQLGSFVRQRLTSSSSEESATDQGALLGGLKKDADFWLIRSQGVCFRAPLFDWLEHMVSADVELLRARGLMDYSLLLRIRTRSAAHTRRALRRSPTGALQPQHLTSQEQERQRRPASMVEASAEAAAALDGDGGASAGAGGGAAAKLPAGAMKGIAAGGTPLFFPALPPMELRCDEVWLLNCRGALALDRHGRGQTAQIGIVDVLQRYDASKRLEHGLKVMRHGSADVDISAVDADRYHARFLGFLDDAFAGGLPYDGDYTLFPRPANIDY